MASRLKVGGNITVNGKSYKITSVRNLSGGKKKYYYNIPGSKKRGSSSRGGG